MDDRDDLHRILGAPPPARSVGELARLAAEQRGLLTRRQCLGAGMTSKAIEVRLSNQRWARAQWAVYQTMPGRDDWRTSALAAQLACGSRAAWSHRTAAFVWGMTTVTPRVIDLVVPDDFAVRSPEGVVVHRYGAFASRLDPLWWPWVTTAEDTLLDVADADDATEDEVMALLGRAFQRGLTSDTVLLARLSGRSRHRRRAFLREMLGDVAGGVESAMERRYLRDVERAHRLPRGTRQRRTSPTRFALHDVGYEEQRVLVELDGERCHEGWAARRKEGTRDRLSAADGWLTVHAYWPDVAVTPCQLALEMSGVLRSRGWLGRPEPCRRLGCAVSRGRG